jgi:hypothetical protein
VTLSTWTGLALAASKQDQLRPAYLEIIMKLTTYSAGPKKKEQQKMSLGAFMTDESKLHVEVPRCYMANTAQNLDPGLTRWRICQSVSIFFPFGIDLPICSAC